MAKLTINKDGSIAYELDDKIPKEATRKQELIKHKGIKDAVKGKGFSSLTQEQKDALLEILLRQHNII